jgi:hypothetical protein
MRFISSFFFIILHAFYCVLSCISSNSRGVRAPRELEVNLREKSRLFDFPVPLLTRLLPILHHRLFASIHLPPPSAVFVFVFVFVSFFFLPFFCFSFFFLFLFFVFFFFLVQLLLQQPDERLARSASGVSICTFVLAKK